MSSAWPDRVESDSPAASTTDFETVMAEIEPMGSPTDDAMYDRNVAPRSGVIDKPREVPKKIRESPAA